MAEIAAGFLGPVIEAVVKGLAALIIRQFKYLCCFTTNITTLKHEAQKLDDAVGRLQGQVDRARDDVQVIVPQVETWLKNSKAIKQEMNGILDEVPNVESGSLNLRARFYLSKRAKETADRIKELRQCKFDVISLPGPPTTTRAVPLGMAYPFESRKQIEEDIMTSLRGGDLNMIGICGMGGLGKTTMAKIIMNRALDEHVFEEVVMVVVSQPVDELKIQLEIGRSLGLDLKGETSQASRVQKLHARLSGTKRILLVLDDVWERLELEDLGIPCGSKGCTILLTSRNSDVLSLMNVEKDFGMEVLSEEDAWLLFRGRADTCVDDTKLNSIAKQVVQECIGLPIALTTVGAALKDERNVSIWKDALQQLRQGKPDIPEFIAKVYNPLKLSYDVLGSKHTKTLFLLCCLFREDDDIPLEDLTYFCVGLGIFEGGIRNLEEARNSMYTLTNTLKSRSLLLDSRYNNCVRMHDVVRDVCIFIAKQEGYIGDNDCAWISPFQLPTRLGVGFLKLRLLFLIRISVKEDLKFDSTFVEGIRDLYVLSIRNYSLKSLTHTTQPLKNLKTLLLYSCLELETLSVVGELVNLEILICHSCHLIKELPQEMKGLHRLKLLELTNCYQLESIGAGIISSLVGLEELKMLGSFKKWEASDREERENTGVRELEALTNLTCLEIEIDDPALVAEKMLLSSKLERFEIIIPSYTFLPDYPSNKKMSLELKGETCLGDWIEMQLLRDTECLHLTGNGANNVDLAKSQNLRWLMLAHCKTMKNIVRTSMDGATVFPSIECLELYCLPELKEIWDGPFSSNSFQNLKELKLYGLPALKQFWKSSSSPIFHNLSFISISSCPGLHNLGQLSIAGHDCLSQLQTLDIEGCEMMEQVFLWNEEDENKINYVVSVLTNLSSINISDCPRLRNLCQLSNAGDDCLSQLQVLHIERCEMMEQVFLWNEEYQNKNNMITIKFPKLKEVELSSLPNLATLYQGIEGIEFPLLSEMSIKRCPKMTGSNENNLGDTSNAGIDYDSSPSKVSFGSLKKLTMKRSENLFGYHVSSFNGLEKLTISGYEGSMSLFTTSIARNLVSLRELSIWFCHEMVKVIEDEEEEENVVSAGQRMTLLFPKLQELTLGVLRKLVSFCEWKYDVELPSLRRVDIFTCPNMKNFTLGPLTTPNLEIFMIKDIGFEWRAGDFKDLSGALQQHLVRAKEKQEEEEEEEEEEDDDVEVVELHEEEEEDDDVEVVELYGNKSAGQSHGNKSVDIVVDTMHGN